MIKTTIKKEWHGQEVKIQGKKVVGKTIYEVGLVVEGQAKLLCPKDWGYLAASITTQAWDGRGTEPEDSTKYSRHVKTNLLKKTADYESAKVQYSLWDMYIQAPKEDMEVYVGTPLEYGPYVEFGTIRSRAQPFLRPALDLAMGKTLTIFEQNGRMEFKDYIK